jgi:hypothetical protein
MKEINLADFFEVVQDENYCIVKRGDIEKYKAGADFDIFCFDMQSFSKKIIISSQTYINDGYELKINDSRNTHWHIDLLKDKKVEIRFDLYSSLPSYKNINIKDGLFSSIIENRVEENILLDNKKIKVFYPSLVDEIIIKYLEYIENYKLRPDKVKHLDYILEKLEEDSDNKIFLDKLHFYTSFSKDLTPNKKNDYSDLLKEIIVKVKATPLKELPKKAIRFIKKRVGK